MGTTALIPLRTQRVEEFIEIRQNKISPTRLTLAHFGPFGRHKFSLNTHWSCFSRLRLVSLFLFNTKDHGTITQVKYGIGGLWPDKHNNSIKWVIIKIAIHLITDLHNLMKILSLKIFFFWTCSTNNEGNSYLRLLQSIQ